MRARVGVCLLAALVCAQTALGGKASNLFKQGRKAERAGKMAQAYLLYSQAAALEPNNKSYWLRSLAVRTRAALETKAAAPAVEGGLDLDLDLDSSQDEPLSQVTMQDLVEARKLLPPPELSPDPGRKNLNLRAPARTLFEEVAKAFGLEVIFDADYPAEATPLPFHMEDAGFREAIHAIESATGSFIVPLGDKLFLAAKDTPQKRNDIEPQISVTIPIPQALTIQEAQELARSVQQVMEIRRFGIDSARRLALLAGPVSKVIPAQQLFERLLTYRSEVSLELEFIEVTKTELRSFGLQLPTSFPVIPLTTWMNHVPVIPEGLSYMIAFGGGASVFGVGMLDIGAIARLNRSDSRLLLRSTLRSLDGQQATFHVGDRYPILTAGYFGPADFGGDDAYRPPPSFNFEDLGLTVKVTPRTHGSEEVSMDIDAEFKVLGGAALNGIPVISNRKLTSRVRLKHGETAVLAGLMTVNEARGISGLAGLSQIPGLGALLRSNQNTRDATEVIVVLRPRLLSGAPEEEITPGLWVGTEARPRLPM
jgi:hypothetical protein